MLKVKKFMSARSFIFFIILLPAFVLCGEGINFEKQILPILEERCIECHKAPYEKNGRMVNPKAGLRMDGLAHLMFGSDDGLVLVPNHPSKSPLYFRVALPADDDDRMPPKGDPLTLKQKDLLRQWIGQGADFGAWQGAIDGIDKLVRTDSLEQAKVPDFVTFFQKLGDGRTPADSELIQSVRKTTGLLIRPVGKGSPLLEVRVVTRHDRINNEAVEKLLPLAKWVVRLDIRDSSVTDDVCVILNKFPALLELNLRGCDIGDEGALQLAGLMNLQTLNLGNTEVTNNGVTKLLKLPALKTLNLWQSKAGADPIKFGPVRSGLQIIN